MDVSITTPYFAADTGRALKSGIQNSKKPESDARTQATAHKVATEFEALFAGMMVKSMRSSLGPDKLTGGGHAEEIMQSMLDQEYATAIAQQGSLGISRIIEKELLEDARRTKTPVRSTSGNP